MAFSFLEANCSRSPSLDMVFFLPHAFSSGYTGAFFKTMWSFSLHKIKLHPKKSIE